MKEALLIIDVQNDYFPGGTNELVHAYEAENKIRELIADSRAEGRPIKRFIQSLPSEERFRSHR